MDSCCMEHEKMLIKLEQDNVAMERRVAVLEETTESIHSMSVSIAVICEQLQTQTKGISNIGVQIEDLNNRVDSIELNPAKAYNAIKKHVVSVIVDAVIALAMSGIVWAILQVNM